MLATPPELVVGTPSRLLAQCEAGQLELKTSVKLLVIDEADLVFSYGYEEDLVALLGHLPKIHQTMLMSATLGSEVEALRKLVLRRPVVLRLEESDLPEGDQLAQHTIHLRAEDRYLVTYALLKLRLLRGKTIMFLRDIGDCYRLKLFLEHFSINSCVLNSELPLQSRRHIVAQFNKGVYDYVIASDEGLKGTLARPKRSGGKKRKDDEYGVSRGVDFEGVANVLNFDFPDSVDAYIHRVGRSAPPPPPGPLARTRRPGSVSSWPEPRAGRVHVTARRTARPSVGHERYSRGRARPRPPRRPRSGADKGGAPGTGELGRAPSRAGP